MKYRSKPRPCASPTVGDCKGHPTLSLPLKGGSDSFTFGLGKAEAILAHLGAVQAFAAQAKAQAAATTAATAVAQAAVAGKPLPPALQAQAAANPTAFAAWKAALASLGITAA